MIERARTQVLLLVGVAAACSSASEPDVEAPGVVKLSAWTIGPETSSYTRKTNVVEGARRLNQELAAAGDPRRVDIAVDFGTLNHEPYARKLVFAFASGRAPDIVCGGHELIGLFAPPGYLLPLEDLLAAHPAFRDDFFPVLWSATRWHGVVYGIPQDNEVRLSYIRQDLLRRLGWSANAIDGLSGKIQRGEFSLADLADLTKAAVAAGVVAPARGLYHRTRVGFDWLEFLLAYGGRLEDPSTGQLVLPRAATLQTLRLFDRLIDERSTPAGMMSYPERTLYGDFLDSSVLVYLTGGSWHKLEWIEGFGLGQDEFAHDVGYFPVPGGGTGPDGEVLPPVSVSHPMACAVNAATADPELAFRVIQRSIDPDLDVAHALGSSHLVVRQSSSQAPAYASDPFLKDMIALLRFTHFAPNHVKLTRLQRILYDGIRGVEVGVLTPEEALEFIERVARARLGDNIVVED